MNLGEYYLGKVIRYANEGLTVVELSDNHNTQVSCPQDLCMESEVKTSGEESLLIQKGSVLPPNLGETVLVLGSLRPKKGFFLDCWGPLPEGYSGAEIQKIIKQTREEK